MVAKPRSGDEERGLDPSDKIAYETDCPLSGLGALSEDPPYVIARPERRTLPLVLASPHSGRNYSAAFLNASALGMDEIRGSEDCFVDQLFDAAPSFGAPLLAATFPRAFVDANREAWELDPALIDGPLPDHANASTPRVAAGLGSIPRVITGGVEIYDRRLTLQEAEGRIGAFYMPYHAALRDLIDETVVQFGYCIFLDCHSMPSSEVVNHRPMDIVLGDCYGVSCHASLTRFVRATLARQGLGVTRNTPYAGGYCTRHYGHPGHGVHALQIEINRGLYMNEYTFEPHDGFAAMQSTMSKLVAAFGDFDGKQLL